MRRDVISLCRVIIDKDEFPNKMCKRLDGLQRSQIWRRQENIDSVAADEGYNFCCGVSSLGVPNCVQRWVVSWYSEAFTPCMPSRFVGSVIARSVAQEE